MSSALHERTSHLAQDTRKLLCFSDFAFQSNTKFSRSLGKLPPASPRTAEAEAEAVGSCGSDALHGSGGLHLARAGNSRTPTRTSTTRSDEFAATRAHLAVARSLGWQRTCELASAEDRVARAETHMLDTFRAASAAHNTCASASAVELGGSHNVDDERSRTVSGQGSGNTGGARERARTALRIALPTERRGARSRVSIRDSSTQTEADVLLTGHTKHSSYGLLEVLSSQALVSHGARAGRFRKPDLNPAHPTDAGEQFVNVDAVLGPGSSGTRSSRGGMSGGGAARIQAANRLAAENEARRLHKVFERCAEHNLQGVDDEEEQATVLMGLMAEKEHEEMLNRLKMDSLHAQLDAAAAAARTKKQLDAAISERDVLREELREARAKNAQLNTIAAELSRCRAILTPPQLAALHDGSMDAVKAHRASTAMELHRASLRHGTIVRAATVRGGAGANTDVSGASGF